MMTFSLEDIFSSIHRVADTLPIESCATSARFGEHRSLYRGEGYDFDRVVEYDPGIHSVSQIDWRSRDSGGRVYVRESRITKDFTVILLIDLSSSMLFGVEHQHKERMLLECVGNIGLACFHAQDPMGLVGFSEHIVFNESPRVSEDNVYYLVEQLYDFFNGTLLDGRGCFKKSRTDFYNAFDFLMRTYAGTKCFVIAISDFIGIDNIPNPQILEDFSGQHEVVFIFLDDPTEFGIKPGPGFVRVEDIETGKQQVISRKKFRREGMRIRRQRKVFRDMLEGINIDSMVLEYGKHFSRLHRFFDARYESFKT